MSNEVRNRFSRVSVRVPIEGVSRTKQSMAAECDINNIMKKYVKTGTISHFNRFGSRYGDFPAVTFHEAMNVVRAGEEMFEALPAEVRRKFDNNAESFLEFVQDPENLPEMRELGLAKPAKPAIAGSSSEPPQAARSGEGGPGAQPPAPAKPVGEQAKPGGAAQ